MMSGWLTLRFRQRRLGVLVLLIRFLVCSSRQSDVPELGRWASLSPSFYGQFIHFLFEHLESEKVGIVDCIRHVHDIQLGVHAQLHGFHGELFDEFFVCHIYFQFDVMPNNSLQTTPGYAHDLRNDRQQELADDFEN